MAIIKSGYLPFKQWYTYYRIVGAPSEQPPLLLLHGGPGSSHNYFEVLDQLADMSHRQVIMYDQLGCGKSSIPDENPTVYNARTWVQELVNVRQQLHLNRVHLLGQSWGGMLALIYLCDYHPQGIQSVILSSTLSSARLWSSELNRLIKFLPQDDQQAIYQAEAANDFSGAAYQEANRHFMELHAAKVDESSPAPVRRPVRGGELAYLTAWGPNEYTPTGNLRNYEYTAQLSQVKTPALIIDGTNDLCTPLVAKTMADHLPNAEWHLFQGARHMVFVEQTAAYEQLVTKWLNRHDGWKGLLKVADHSVKLRKRKIISTNTGRIIMKLNNKKRLMAVMMTAVLASPVVASSFALADNNATGSPDEQADITNWIANTPQQISNNMAMQHIDTNNLNGTRYIIQWGDTLSGISAATGISVAKLCYDNNIQNANLIYAGDVLILNRNGSVPAGYNPNVNPNVVAQTKVTINNGPTNVNIVVKPQSITKNDDHSTNVYTANGNNGSENESSASSSSATTSDSSAKTTKRHKHHKLSAGQIVDDLSDAAGDDSKLSFEKYDADDNSDAKEIDDDAEAAITKDIKNNDYDQAVKDIQDQLDDDDKDATVYVEYSDGEVHVYIQQSNDDDDSSDSSSSSKNSDSSSQATSSNNDEDTYTTDDDD